MRIVHAPTEISGQMHSLVSGLRSAGHQANGYNWFLTYLNYNGSLVNTDAFELIKMIEPLANYVDIFHFHNSNSMLANSKDIPLLHERGNPMVMHHWGNDVRNTVTSLRLNPYPVPPSYYSDAFIHDNLSFFGKHMKHAIVQDYELYPHVSDYYEHVHVLPLACEVKNISCSYPSLSNSRPLIIHAPTNREFKGSVSIEKAIQDVKATRALDYRAIENMSHQEAIAEYRKADIIIDQVLCGTYGALSVEAMAMGKVVVAYVRDDVKARLPESLPIVIANPDTIADVLKDLVVDAEKRNRIGRAGRLYVENYHAVDKVVPQLLSIYSLMMGGRQ